MALAVSDHDLTLLAETIYGEARGERDGDRLLPLIAVGHVVLNRVRADLFGDGRPDWWGEGIAEVCLKPGQFSCHFDHNRAAIDAAGLANRRYREAFAVACLITAGTPGAEPSGFDDPTAGSTHYCRTDARPYWRVGREPAVIIGHHAFFNDIVRRARSSRAATSDATH